MFLCEEKPPCSDAATSIVEGCPFPAGHRGRHRAVALHQGLIEWQASYECECCTPDDPTRCFWYRTIKPS